MKKVILSVLSVVAVILSVIVLAYACSFLIEIQTAPELLVHIVNYPHNYYEVQNELVARWESYCVAIIALASVAIAVGIAALCFINFYKHRLLVDKASRAESRKAAKIAKLEQELETLKKDGD